MKKILLGIAIVATSFLVLLGSNFIILFSNATTINPSFTYPELLFTVTGGHKFMLVRQLTTFFLCVTVFVSKQSFIRCMILSLIYHILFTFFNFKIPHDFNDIYSVFLFFIRYLPDYYLWLIVSYIYSILICKFIISQYQKLHKR